MQENNTARISSRLRHGLDTGANWVADRKGPLEVATEKTLKLNGISHESAARLVRQQANFFEGTVDAAARRLKTAAKADSFRALIDDQIKLLPETRDRIVDDLRKTFAILTDTREDLGQLLRETLSDLRANSNIDDAADKVSSAARDLGEKAKDAAGKAKGKAKDAAEEAKEAVSH